ncbi:MAG TPA: tRNA (adenosine(37)-N6)-threonylcarbamoyltransferase complex transferase subunit TsaD [Prosthecobacter sp.]|nr:tRNA (adenosine(37)-N6)-threonylcarbamoyltransferase complex transferase subunit TsaD [Prosthecobacter sp.]HRK13149.1 tRNA (adenosine(37)-N6)-threonylcarbamoyltransferase complex transferase subunit TsaD [Prosthecobacter sp.]
MILALESSCDETAAAICAVDGRLLAARVSSQADIHRRYGGVVPEVASRNHILHARPLVEQVLSDAGAALKDISAFAATSGPGLVSSLLIGASMAKAMAVAEGKPFFAVNHMEGHLLSPFMEGAGPVRANVSLIVSGGHTMLVRVRAAGDYQLLGKTRDDAAGEAFDKTAKMLGLPYPGGPEMDKQAALGNPRAFAFPRSFLDGRSLEFSFSGLKTAVLYELPKLDLASPAVLADVCASVQEAIIEVLVEKLALAARQCGEKLVTVSGGVSCNRGLRARLASRFAEEGLTLLLARPDLCTDNAGMIAFAALQHFLSGRASPLDADVDPNLPLVA